MAGGGGDRVGGGGEGVVRLGDLGLNSVKTVFVLELLRERRNCTGNFAASSIFLSQASQSPPLAQ